ncbi:hypothetical protein EUGRSUZ_B03408 [Eucalyptus grandis]|uniref:Uncharacterized protein n=2 Tax=Eucalyptus grandis TaxID=71139 RepID=A0ACC3LWS1_EUCGR|nr:hypothetical protein EUGRSUZ_B03408 [Eucalyptus grandis]
MWLRPVTILTFTNAFPYMYHVHRAFVNSERWIFRRCHGKAEASANLHPKLKVTTETMPPHPRTKSQTNAADIQKIVEESPAKLSSLSLSSKQRRNRFPP